MDDIQILDCFERLHQHLLYHEPQLQKRITEEFVANRYRQQPPSFFITYLVALLSGLDPKTAEAKRRIRRLVIDIDTNGFLDCEASIIREKGGVFELAITDAQLEKLRVSVRNLRLLGRACGDGEVVGEVFHNCLMENASLQERIVWLRRQFPCLTRLNAIQYLSAIGYPVLVPNSKSQVFLFRMGLLKETGPTSAVQFEACCIVESLARSLKQCVGEINFWIQAFVGNIRDFAASAILCGTSPRCGHCNLQTYCHYFRYQRPKRADANAPLGIKDWRPTDRPRERLLQSGAHALEDSELLAIVLRTGTGKTNVVDLARFLLERFGSLQGIEEATIEELREVHGIGKMKAVELKAIFELGRRQSYKPLVTGDVLDESSKVFDCYRARFSRVKQEEFILLMLDTKMKLIREEVISRGSLDAAVVQPREVFKAAIRASAAMVMFIHNHPSGDPSPSHDDFVITQRLEEAAELLQIQYLDHLIIGESSYYSFADAEIIQVD